MRLFSIIMIYSVYFHMTMTFEESTPEGTKFYF